MPRHFDRRQLLLAGAAALASATRPFSRSAPAAPTSGAARAIVVSSANGHRYKNGGPRTAVEETFARLVAGEDVLDAVLAGVSLNELDPADDSVGYGGLPNADGVVQLDASVMHGAKRRAGAVAALEGVRTPSRVARAVADLTDHHLLVGKGAQDLARRLGFPIEDELNTDNSRRKWLEWKRRLDPQRYLDPARRAHAADRARESMIADGLIDPQRVYGTIHMSALSPAGQLAGATSTSGLSWKIPGRVGDSPILGAGLYVDGEVGAAGSTGRGEANLWGLSSFLIVEKLREGRHPLDAGMEALSRVRSAAREARLLNVDGNPDFDLKFYVLDIRGRLAGVSLYANYKGKATRFAVATEKGAEERACEALLESCPKGPRD